MQNFAKNNVKHPKNEEGNEYQGQLVVGYNVVTKEWQTLAGAQFIPERQRPAFMGESVVWPSQVLPVQTAQQFMGCQVARALRHSDQQFLLGIGKPLGFHECMTQQGMDAGLEVQQAERFGGGADRFLETPRLKMDGG